ncbi:unnamed protein product [Spirodela intermedia]|uniref:Peptidase A1 domain-containing protein n=1 Tax=Spirodela intermedia TaxID=51605 RepID=A0A7I8IDW8_SPIIN|nr:unnamed protein product [Spirodela intermedia]CAA6656017.1 unnamed protein product [Spirodela intermedia]
MATAPSAFLLFLLAVGPWTPTGCLAGTFGFDFHHRFSDRVRQWAESGNWVEGHGSPLQWPKEGTVEYYAALVDHDRVHRGRSLAGADSPLTFLLGNETIRVRTLGFLHYAEVSVGTPSTSFFVALDTGSDLSGCPATARAVLRLPPRITDWYYPLPLRCGSNFSIYSPSSSSTSKTIPCSSVYCELRSQCPAGDSQCPYNVRYLSENTSTTGVLVQDVLHLRTDDSHNKTVEAQVVLGCGQTQTGHFLDSAAPNGLFGLGMTAISVPSILSKAGITSNSFSMCFGRDGIGRIRFGDLGSSDQAETHCTLMLDSDPTYIVTVNGIRIGSVMLTGVLRALVDSGTSFTYLTDPVYSLIARSFNSDVQDVRVSIPDLPFEYCYVLRPNESKVPSIGLIMEGGSEFLVHRPVILVSNGVNAYYCLAITKSNDYNIIGQNFMTGLRIVFNRDKLVLGWKEFNCYDQETSTLTVKPGSPGAPPTIAVAPSGLDQEATVNRDKTTGMGPSHSSTHSLNTHLFRWILPLLSLLCMAIL